MGQPPEDMVKTAHRQKQFFESDGTPILKENERGVKKRPGTKSLEEVMKSDSKDFVDFVRQCLAWKPEDRMTPEKSFSHPWIADGVKRIRAENKALIAKHS